MGVLDGLNPEPLQFDPTPAQAPLPSPASPVAHSTAYRDPGGEEYTAAPVNDYRDFGDPSAARKLIYGNVLDEARKLQPIANKVHTLQLKDVDYDGPDHISLKEQKRAILEGRTLGRRLRGTWQLMDNATGGVLDERKVTLAEVPHMTHRGTFILNGTEYTLANQMRLRPGVFTRVKENGEVESHINVMPGKGASSRVLLDPETGVFRLNLGQGKIPLMPILKALGKSDSDLRREWGNDLYAANARHDDNRAVDKLYEKLLRSKADPNAPEEDRRQALRAAFEKMELDPEVTRRTLGGAFKNVGADTLMATTKRLVAVNKGEAEPDDRDHLAYQSMLGPEDLFAERMRAAARVIRPALWKATMRRNLGNMQPGFLTRQIQAAITGSGLGQPLEEINPADVFDQQTRVSRLGEGGIPSIDSVPDEARSVQPSHFGFVDPLRTPESFKVGVDTRLSYMARKGKDGRVYTPFLDVRTGKTDYKSPQDLADSVIAFPGELASNKKTVAALVKGKLRYVPRANVDFALPEMEHGFSPLANMIPLKSTIKGQRVAMGSRMLTQALPIQNGESPLVQGGIPGVADRSYEEEYGRHMGAVGADTDGVVQSVSPDEIKVRYADGTVKSHELYDHFPLNRKTYIHNTPLVQPGQAVRAGEMLAKSNYTDDTGATALGLNMRTAYIPFRGLNFEDATVISRSAAKRLSSEHMYQHDTEWSENVKRGKKAFMGLFANRFDRKTLDTVDDDGVVQPGTRVNPGDPLVLMAKERERAHNQVSRGKDASFADQTLTWDHHAPGVVTDVAKTKKGVVVTVKSLNEMQVGDKLSGRYGDKGVIADIIDDEEMPHGPDGKPYEVLVNPLGIITRCYDEQTEFMTSSGWKFGREVSQDDMLGCFDPHLNTVILLNQSAPMNVADYDGLMLSYTSKVLDFCVTPNHKMWTRGDWPGASWSEKRADEIIGRRYHLPVAAEAGCANGTASPFLLPVISRNGIKDTAWSDASIEIDAGDWAEFLGWYIAEGNITWNEKEGEYRTHVSQSDTVKPTYQRRIAELMDRLPFKWNYNSDNIQFHLSSKRLASYLRPLGLAQDKFIPDWVFDQPFEVRARFLDAYWCGDGSVREAATGVVSQASTVSRRLADDLQRLLVMQGESGAVYPKNEKPGCRPAWCVSRHSVRHRTTSVDGWEEIDYSGKIYCPTVPTGYVVTRRNGKLLIAGNTNPGQMVEAVLGKIAAVTGKRYRVTDFKDINDMVAYAQQELTKHHMTDVEDLMDPVTQRKIPGVFTGNRFFMKLHHTSESKGQGRGTGGYTAEEMPAKGGETGSKRVSMMDINAFLSHGAHEVQRDVGAIRGQKNQDWWAAFMQGKTPPQPRIPFVNRKFYDQLRASGINPVRTGGQTQIMAMTNKDVDHLAGDRYLENSDTVDWKGGLKPIKGGLFDQTLTGGHNGNRWAAIKLHEPMPNPVMEEPIRRVLGMTEKRFEAILGGKEELGGLSGPKAIQHALGRIDVSKEIEKARAEMTGSKKTARDSAIKRLAYLKTADRLKMHPRDWMLDKVPVLPPIFRPVSVMAGNKQPMVADPNYLYKEVMDANDNLKHMTGQVDDVSEERLALYRAFKGVTGLGEPIQPKNQERQVKGILKYVFGNSPKFGVVQRKLLGSTTDLVGRAVITPNPNLDMDQVGIPESKAWEIYKPFVIRRLSRHGVSPLMAAQMVQGQHALAKKALTDEMGERPVIVTRAPVLHRYGTMAFYPQLTKGETLQVPPTIVKGFAADFDGDAMNYHVPVTDEAVRDAVEKMLPSKNLFAASTFKAHYLPQNEYVGGLYEGTRPADDRPEQVFRSKNDAIRAFQQGRIGPRTKVVIVEA
jgi:DNA-directed RNA polymerase beta subunit